MNEVLDMLTPPSELGWFLLVVNIPSMLFSLYSLRWVPSLLLGSWGMYIRGGGLLFGLLVTTLWYEAARTIDVSMTGASPVSILETVVWGYATALVLMGAYMLMMMDVVAHADRGAKW